MYHVCFMRKWHRDKNIPLKTRNQKLKNKSCRGKAHVRKMSHRCSLSASPSVSVTNDGIKCTSGVFTAALTRSY